MKLHISTCTYLCATDWFQLSTIRSMQKYEEVFGYLHASFVTASCIYRNSCEELLSPLALSDAQLCELLENRDSSSWESPDLSDALHDRLGNNYLPFKHSVKQLNKKINLFGKKLQLSDKFHVSKLELTRLFRLIRDSRLGQPQQEFRM